MESAINHSSAAISVSVQMVVMIALVSVVKPVMPMHKVEMVLKKVGAHGDPNEGEGKDGGKKDRETGRPGYRSG